MNKLELIDVTNFLPHRKPFLMVDKVLSLDDNHISTSFKIQEDCIFIENNFLSEVGLIENAAQTCSGIVGKSFFDDNDIEGNDTKLIGFISAIKKVTINSCPSSGSTIISKANLKSRFDNENFSICTLECIIYEEENELLSCEMNLFVREMK